MRAHDIAIHRNRRRTAWIAILVAVAAGGAATPFLTADNTGLQLIGAIWLGAWANLVCSLLDRMAERGPVVIIDDAGIHDTRLLARPIEWWEIEFVYPINPRSQVVELQLRDPHRVLASAPWHMRLGLDWLRPLDLPEVCINLVLLDGSASDVIEAIRRHAPHLLPRTGTIPHRAPSWSRP